jgi:hypothetical protein
LPLIVDALYWIRGKFAGRAGWAVQILRNEGLERMTYLELVFPYRAVRGEREVRAIDAMLEVYGIRRVQFNEKDRTVRVEFDASRMKQDSVAKLLRQAGIAVGEPLTLA